MTETDTVATSEKLMGIGVSPGVVVGPVFLMAGNAVTVVERRIEAGDIDREILRLEAALIATRGQIRTIQKGLESQAGMRDASILDAHLMVMDDRAFIEEVVAQVRNRRCNVEAAVRDVTESYVAVLQSMEDDYLRERVADVQDVSRRIIRNLGGAVESSLASLSRKHIVVAVDLAPSDTAALRRDVVAGFATDLGSPTSHTAVMARALELPAVVAARRISERVRSGDMLLIDGNKGVLIVNPTEEQLEAYGAVTQARRTIEAGFADLRNQPAETKDHRRIVLSANIEHVDEIAAVADNGAEGVGLFRSEYLFIFRGGVVSEQEQTEVYSDLAKRLAPNPVIIRTLDLGGDKFYREGASSLESNPFLGCRSIRLSLRHTRHFKDQLRAILRASVHANVKVMYPMISGVDELHKANALLDAVKHELDGEGIPFHRDLDVGVMIEVPSAALIADVLAGEVSFFSLGTNDLVQYTIAVDRVNERVAYLYEPTHPGVLRLIKMAVDAGHAKGIWVGVCGQMAADPVMTPLLLGLGVDEMSVSPQAVPLIKDAVRSVTIAQCRDLAATALACSRGRDVLEHCRDVLRASAPELLELV